MNMKTINGRERSSPSLEYANPAVPSRANGIFFINIRAMYTRIPIIPNWAVISRKILHLGFVLSNSGVNLSRADEVKNANTKHIIATHATAAAFTRVFIILVLKKKVMCYVGAVAPRRSNNTIG